MIHFTKIAILGTSLVTLAALTACQSATSGNMGYAERMHHGKYGQKFTPEQREHMQIMHGMQRQAMQQMQTACDGQAVGTTLKIKVNDQSIEGTCNMRFSADRSEMQKLRGEYQAMRGNHMRGNTTMMNMHRNQPMTDAQRAELTKQFDQRLALRQVHHNAMLQACQGKANGTATQLILGEQTINGKCEVRFQPNAPVAPTKTPRQSPAP